MTDWAAPQKVMLGPGEPPGGYTFIPVLYGTRQGFPFRPAAGHTQINFTNMPVGARVRIYTPLGELVRTLNADGNGQAVWDARNASGQQAASGLYLAYIDDGGSNVTLKVAIQR